jgi:hypothetical protein
MQESMEKEFDCMPLPQWKHLSHTIYLMIEKFKIDQCARMEKEDPSTIGEEKIYLLQCSQDDLKVLYQEVDLLRYETNDTADENKTEYLSKAQGQNEN